MNPLIVREAFDADFPCHSAAELAIFQAGFEAGWKLAKGQRANSPPKQEQQNMTAQLQSYVITSLGCCYPRGIAQGDLMIRTKEKFPKYGLHKIRKILIEGVGLYWHIEKGPCNISLYVAGTKGKLL